MDGSALYGDPALNVRLDLNAGTIPGSLYSQEILHSPGFSQDTVTVRVTMNREGSPGYTSKWGNRHPTVLFPFRAYDIEVLFQNCMSVVVMDNFALMYVWHQGMGEFPAGTSWELVFTCNPVSGIGAEPEFGYEVPREIELYPIYPNPFNPTANIKYHISAPGYVTIGIYNILGQKVWELKNTYVSSGEHTAVWDGKSDIGTEAASGIYICRFQVADKVESRRLLLIR